MTEVLSAPVPTVSVAPRKILEERWDEFIFNTGAGINNHEIFYKLKEKYDGYGRYYHTTNHILSSLEEFENIKGIAEIIPDHPIIEMAIWWHDIIQHYPSQDMNEELSKTECIMAGWHLNIQDIAAAAGELILLTNHKLRAKTELSVAAQYFLDIDLAILGRPWYEFDIYEKQIRAEYNFISDRIFYQKRTEILESFLKRDKIYYTKHFQDKYEASARDNIIHAVWEYPALMVKNEHDANRS